MIPWTVTLAGTRHTAPTLRDAEELLRELLPVAPPGAVATAEHVAANGSRRVVRYVASRGGGISRSARHPGGRPTQSPEGRRQAVLVRLAPSVLVELDAMARADGASRGGVVDRLVLEEARRRAGAAG